MSKFDFTGKKALVTGASRGFGKSIAAALLEGGAKVYAVGRSKENLDALVKEYPNMTPICADVSDMKDLKEKLAPHHPFDILVNNAGVAQPQPFFDATEEAYDKIMNVNLKAPFFLTQLVSKEMQNHKLTDGVVLNVSSIGSKKGTPWNHAYASSKAGLDHLTINLAVELGPLGIRVNCINPGLIAETDMAKQVMTEFPAELIENMMKTLKLPLVTWPNLAEYTDAALFLVSDKAKKITGITLNMSSGLEL